MLCGIALALPEVASAPQSIFPDIRLGRVELFAVAPELTAHGVRERILAPLETAFGTLPNLAATRAFIDAGKLELELDFRAGGTEGSDLGAVRAALADVRSRLPPSVEIATIAEGPEAEPVLAYALVSKTAGQAELERRLQRALGAAFIGTPQLGRITVFAGPRAAFEVWLNPRRLSAAGLHAADVAREIGAAGGERVAGTVARGDERLAVLAGEDALTPAALANLRVRAGARTLRIGDLGDVRAGEEQTGRQASFDAQHAVLLNLYVVPGGDAVALRRAVQARLAQLRAALPADTALALAWDQTRLIERSQAALRWEMAVGAAIALLVIAGFLRERALTLVAATVLGVAALFTLAGATAAGLHLDLMTIGGLAIAIGLIVDETIVVVEAIASGLAAWPDEPPRAAIARAVRRIARPLVAATAANLVVFLPLSLLGGVPGFFFRALATTMAAALIVSTILSLIVAPVFAEPLVARRSNHERSTRLEDAYALVLKWTLRRAPLVIALGTVCVVAAAVMLLRTPSDFLPDIDEGQFEIAYALPPGMTLAAADAAMTRVEQQLLADADIAHVARLSGVDTNGYLATAPDAGTMRVTLKAEAERKPFDAIATRVRDEVHYLQPYAALEVHQLLEDQINDLSGAPEPVQLRVSGPDQRELAKIAGELADRLVRIDGLVDVFDGITYEARSVRAAPPSGLASTDVSAEVSARTGGLTAAEIPGAGGPIPVVVRVVPQGPLERTVRLGPPQLTTALFEENGTPTVRVTAGIEDDASLSTVSATIERSIAPILHALPPGYRVEVDGASAAQQVAFAQFAGVFAIAVLLVFGVLVMTFDSFALPLVVLAAVPPALVGLALALAVTRTPLNVASFMGLLLLIGIVVRSGILLVDSARRQTREGADPVAAIVHAGRERLRPILMTTLAALGALAPLALGIGAGSEMERPLAIAAIGGLIAATALTLLIVPPLYVAVARSYGPPSTIVPAPSTSLLSPS